MKNKTAAILIAAALVGGNVMSGFASNLKIQDKGPVRANGYKVQQQQHHFSPPQQPGPNGLQADLFKAKCVTGFSKFEENKVIKAGVPVVQSFGCRTAWIKCPKIPNYPLTTTEIEVKDQGTGDEGKKYRVEYRCAGLNIAG